MGQRVNSHFKTNPSKLRVKPVLRKVLGNIPKTHFRIGCVFHVAAPIGAIFSKITFGLNDRK